MEGNADVVEIWNGNKKGTTNTRTNATNDVGINVMNNVNQINETINKEEKVAESSNEAAPVLINPIVDDNPSTPLIDNTDVSKEEEKKEEPTVVEEPTVQNNDNSVEDLLNTSSPIKEPSINDEKPNEGFQAPEMVDNQMLTPQEKKDDDIDLNLDEDDTVFDPEDYS